MSSSRLLPASVWLSATLALAPVCAHAQALACLLEPERVAEVGTPVIGVIASLHAERGERVVAGQVLAVLRNDVEQASLRIAQARSQAEAELRGARANLAFARQKLGRAVDLEERKFLSQQAVDQARAEASVAEQRLAQAEEQQRVSRQELTLAEAQLALRTIRAPFDGVIAERFANAGERVEDRPLFRMARIDPLRAELVLPSSMYGAIREGMALSVVPDLPGARPHPARVILVDRLVDGASNTFRVRAELRNLAGRIPSGLRCQVAFDTSKPAGSPPASALPVPAAQNATPQRSARASESVAAMTPARR